MVRSDTRPHRVSHRILAGCGQAPGEGRLATDWESVYKTEFNQPANVIAQCRPCHDDYEDGRISRDALQQRRCHIAFVAARQGIYQDYLWSELAQRGEGRSNLDALATVMLWTHLSCVDGALAKRHRFIIAPDHYPCDAFHLHVDLPQGRMSACAGLPCGRFEVWSPAKRIEETFRSGGGGD